MSTGRRTTLLATAALLGMTATWGSTFYLIHDLLDRMPTLDFLAVRFALAGVLMLAIAPRAVARLGARSRRAALGLGVLYGLAQILQTAGLAHTPASVSGFVTGMYVVATPLLAAVLLRTRITLLTWAAVVLAVAGLGVLTLSDLTVGYGEAVTLVAAVLYALHIVGLGAWSNARDALGMSIVQILVIAALCLLATAPDGRWCCPPPAATGRRWRTWRSSRSPGPARPDLGAGPPGAHPDGDHHEHGAGLRGVLRGAAGRRVRRPPDARRGRPRAGRDAARRARPPPPDRGRGPAPRRLTRPHRRVARGYGGRMGAPRALEESWGLLTVFRTTLARAAPPVRLLAALVVLIGLAFTATTLPGVRDDHPGFWVPVDGWLQGSGYALMALLILLRPLLDRETRTLWWLLAAAVTLRAAGYLVYFAWVRTLVPQPYPSAADPLWLGASLIFVVVIALRTRYFGRDLSRLLVLDGLIAGLTVAGLSVALLRTTLLTLTGPGVPDHAVAVNVIYPILDVVALVLIAGLFASGWRPSHAEAMVATGVALFALVESVYLYELAADTFRPGTWLSALSYLGTLVVVLAAWLPGPAARPVPASATATASLPQRAPVAVPAGLALASLAGLLVMAYIGEPPVLAVVLLMLGLVVTVVRGVLTLVQDREQADVIIASRTRDSARFQSVVEASGDFVLIATLDGRVTFVNAAGREMIGLPPDRDLSTMTYADFLTDASRRSFEEVERPAVMSSGHWEGQSELCDSGPGGPSPSPWRAS